MALGVEILKRFLGKDHQEPETDIDPFNPDLTQEQVAALDPFNQIVNGCARDFKLTGGDPGKNKNKVLRMAREVASDWLAS